MSDVEEAVAEQIAENYGVSEEVAEDIVEDIENNLDRYPTGSYGDQNAAPPAQQQSLESPAAVAEPASPKKKFWQKSPKAAKSPVAETPKSPKKMWGFVPPSMVPGFMKPKDPLAEEAVEAAVDAAVAEAVVNEVLDVEHGEASGVQAEEAVLLEAGSAEMGAASFLRFDGPGSAENLEAVVEIPASAVEEAIGSQHSSLSSKLSALESLRSSVKEDLNDEVQAHSVISIHSGDAGPIEDRVVISGGEFTLPDVPPKKEPEKCGMPAPYFWFTISMIVLAVVIVIVVLLLVFCDN